MTASLLKSGFVDFSEFQKGCGQTYTLLPLRFLRLDGNRYIVSNFAGEYTVLATQHLQELIQHRLPMHGEVYESLKSKHFLLDGDSTVALDLLAAKYRTKQQHLGQLTSLFLFVLTLRCEHSCHYCQVSRRSQNRSEYDMSLEHADLAVEFVFSSPAASIKIEFQGGEPLLNFELLKRVVERARERNLQKGRNLQFVIATNLALINEDILNFCRSHDIQISTSLDGPQELHNANRPRPGGDSYEKTIAGIRLGEVIGWECVSALMTTSHSTLSQPEAVIDEYVEQGFHSIFLRNLSPFGFAMKTGAYQAYSIAEWLAFYKRELSHIIQLNLTGKPFREEYSALILRKMLTPFATTYVDLQSPAGIGIGALAFNYDGKIFASDESRMLAEMGDDTFCVGHLAQDSFQAVMTSAKLLEPLVTSISESVPMCADCGIQPFCGSDPVYHHAMQGDFVGFKPSSGFCMKQMEVTRHLIRMLEDDPNAREVMLSWIH